MSKVSVLVELQAPLDEAFGRFKEALESEEATIAQAERLLAPLAGLDIEVSSDSIPVPMFLEPVRPTDPVYPELSEFGIPETNPDLPGVTVVVPVLIGPSALEECIVRRDVQVWANSELTLLPRWDPALRDVQPAPADRGDELALPPGGLDCRPFKAAVDIDTIQTLLGVSAAWDDGVRGQGVVVGIIDEGIDGTVYPVAGGFSRPGSQEPGTAPITSHGSMCAADVLIAAPEATLYDYPFLGIPNSGGALAMFQAILDQRRLDGTPHLTSNSYGFVGVPPQADFPTHEIWDLAHPLHRKVREVVASGASAFFAAGNCGQDCPSGACHPSGIGPGHSIHASNSLAEVITIAAVNSGHERIGYSSQGPGMFEREKPDLAAYSHVFANFGPGRPGGDSEAPFDSGTSAATPVAAGVAALLLGAHPALTPDDLRAALVEGATNDGSGAWRADFGRGIVNAAAAYAVVQRMLTPTGS